MSMLGLSTGGLCVPELTLTINGHSFAHLWLQTVRTITIDPSLTLIG